MRKPVYLSTTLALALAAAGCNTPQGQNATTGALSGGANGAMIGASVTAGHPAGIVLGGVFGAAGGAMVASAATSSNAPGAAPNRPPPGANGLTPTDDRPLSVNPAVTAGDVASAPRPNRSVPGDADVAADAGRTAPGANAAGPGGYGALARNYGAEPGYYGDSGRYGPTGGGYGPGPGPGYYTTVPAPTALPSAVTAPVLAITPVLAAIVLARATSDPGRPTSARGPTTMVADPNSPASHAGARTSITTTGAPRCARTSADLDRSKRLSPGAADNRPTAAKRRSEFLGFRRQGVYLGETMAPRYLAFARRPPGEAPWRARRSSSHIRPAPRRRRRLWNVSSSAQEIPAVR